MNIPEKLKYTKDHHDRDAQERNEPDHGGGGLSRPDDRCGTDRGHREQVG